MMLDSFVTRIEEIDHDEIVKIHYKNTGSAHQPCPLANPRLGALVGKGGRPMAPKKRSVPDAGAVEQKKRTSL
jgi:hypothetical protein